LDADVAPIVFAKNLALVSAMFTQVYWELCGWSY